jgi:hypothetical protein
MRHTVSLSIKNASERLRIVSLEPWGHEFLLTLDEKLEVTASAETAEAGFRLVESNNRTLIFVEGCSGASVIKDGLSHDLDLDPIVGTTETEILPAQRIRDPMWDRDLDS